MALREDLQIILGDAYTIERELGGGGMSRVFVATQRELGRQVVVKVLPPDMAAAVSIDRFKREIMLAARLQHPHIVPLLGAGASAEPLWFTMPYVQGHSLRERLSSGGELPIPEVVRILRDVADALAYAHRHGVVHRDIKPENVLLGEGHALVTDFGVSKAIADSTSDANRITATGVALGTPAYMSPEQANAEPHVDHRADIYAFGVLAYELLAGRPPFTGSSPHSVIAAHIRDIPDPIAALRPQIAPELADLVMRCLEKRPADRPKSADELLALLATLATPTGAPSYAPGRAARMTARAKRRSLFIAVAGVVLLALGAGVRAWRGPADAPARARIVVAPFANETGDKALDDLGKVIAGFVQDALTHTGALDVADFRALTTAPAQASVLSPMVPGDNTALADAAGASLVLHGTVFKVGDSLEIRARVIDARTGTVRASIPAERASVGAPMVAVSQIARRAAGALATMFNAQAQSALTGATHVPTYAAYREFTAGMEAYQIGNFDAAADRFKRAIAQDSAFLAASLWLSAAFNNASPGPLKPTGDSIRAILAALDRRRSELSELDRAILDFSLAEEREERIVALRKATAIWPDRWAYTLGALLNFAGRPRETIALFETIDPTKGFMRGWTAYWLVYFWSYLLLGDFEGASDVAHRGRQQYPNTTLTLCLQGIALTGSGRVAEADSLTNAALPGSPPSGHDEAWCRRQLARSAAYFLPPAQQRPILESALRYFEFGARDSSLARSYELNAAHIAMWLGDTARFVAYHDTLRLPRIPDRESLLARSYARALAHDRAGSERFRSAALAIPPHRFDRGATEHWLARIDLALGDVPAAARHASEARKKGRSVDGIHLDVALRQLRGNPVFEALVKR
ncbi:MAG: protein kinase [Gemmatimonadaceae bacterium]